MVFAENFVDDIGPPAGIRTSPNTFWQVLEVNAPQLVRDAVDAESVERRFLNLGVGTLRALSLWTVVSSVAFYFLTDSGELEHLADPERPR
jgi:hypothetical protein